MPAFNKINLNDMTLENLGRWPYPVKIVCCALLGLFVIFLTYLWDTKLQLETLKREKHQERELRESFEKKYFQAASLNDYKKQLAKIQLSLGNMLKQLPNRNELPSLLEDITKSGRTSGLEFKLFDPQPEVKREFYSELPIQIKVKGDYHQFGDFVSRLSALGRIVTLHDLEIKLEDSKSKHGNNSDDPPNTSLLEMTMTAKTYRYSDDEKSNGVKNKEISQASK